MSSCPRFHRALIAIVSALAAPFAYYLHVVKMRPAEAPDPFAVCNVDGACGLVQNSAWGWFLGIDVALIGAIGNAVIFAMAIVSLHPRLTHARWPTLALMALIYPAILFVARLKYAEFVILESFCPWCAVSTIAIVACAVLVTLDYRRFRLEGGVAATDDPAKALEPVR